METVEVLMKMPKIEGYEYTGEYRQAKAREAVLDSDALLRDFPFRTVGQYPILRKAEVWKPLTLEDIWRLGQSKKVVRLRHQVEVVMQGKEYRYHTVSIVGYKFAEHPDLGDIMVFSDGSSWYGGEKGRWEYLED